jgi:hypothetical protein
MGVWASAIPLTRTAAELSGVTACDGPRRPNMEVEMKNRMEAHRQR